MKHDEVTVGMKVVPHCKSIFGYESSEWVKAVNQYRPYLYVLRIDEDKVVLSHRLGSCTGDFFLASDFEPYIEPIPEEPMRNEKPLSPCTPFEPTSEQPFYFNPFDIDPIATLPKVFAFDKSSGDWQPAYFLGHDNDNSLFEVIYQDTRIHEQVQYISPYGKDHVMTAEELFDTALRTQFPIQYNGVQWVFIGVRIENELLPHIPVTYPWLYSVRA